MRNHRTPGGNGEMGKISNCSYYYRYKLLTINYWLRSIIMTNK